MYIHTHIYVSYTYVCTNYRSYSTFLTHTGTLFLSEDVFLLKPFILLKKVTM